MPAKPPTPPVACVLLGLQFEHEWQCAYMAALQHAKLGDGVYEFDLDKDGPTVLYLKLTTDEEGALRIEPHTP